MRKAAAAAAAAAAWEDEQPNDADQAAMDAMSAYAREIARYPLLSRDEERDLFQRLAVARPGSAEAARIREHIFTSNLRLVMWYVRRYGGFLRPGGSIALLDLVQEGNLGLMRAIEKFDVGRGGKFSTYALRWVGQRMGRALESDRGAVHVPAYVQEVQRTIARQTAALTVQLGREPTAAEAALTAHGVQAQAREAGRTVTDEALRAADRVTGGALSLDKPLARNAIGGGGGAGGGGTQANSRTLADVLVADDYGGGEGGGEGGVLGALNTESEAQLARLVARLCTPREAQVIGLRFGHGMTLAEAGTRLHVSRERIRQIEASALTKLRARLAQDVETGGARLMAPRPLPREAQVIGAATSVA